MTATAIDAARTAVLSMDLQAGIVSIYAQDQPDLLERAKTVLNRCRAAGVRVIHVKVGFRAGLPEVSSRNPLFGAIKTSSQHQRLFEGESGAIHPSVAPEPNEVVITKSRVNAFVGTDLEQVLRANGIDTLILFGIATSGVVLSTALHASDADYRLFVVSDCCTDLEADVHECLLVKFFPRRATVVTTEGLLHLL
jgi:nicotinamidase-related amidase